MWTYLSPAIIVGSSLAFVGLERLFPYNRGQKVFRSGFFTDLVLYGIVQSFILGKLITAFVLWLDSGTGLSRLHLVSSWPLGLQLLFFLVLHDFYIYWFHRAQHASSWLWRLHEAHHSVADVDWLAGVRSHALEILVNQTVEFAPIVLLGAAPEVWLMKATIDAVWGMYIHSNLGVRAGLFNVIVNGPELHRWHHARSLAERDANFGTKFGFWDRIFGTLYFPPERAEGFGLAQAGDYPTDFLGQQAAAFRPFRKRAA